MGANTTYLFIDSATMIILAEFTFMFGLCNMGQVVHIAGSRYIVKSIRELVDKSEDSIIEILLDFDSNEKSEVYNFNNYKEHIEQIIEY